MKENIKSLTKYPLTIIFAAFVSIMCLLYALIPDKEISELENRYLQMMPEVSLSALKDGSFMDKYDMYTNDQMPFRDLFIKVKALCEALSLKVENNGIAKGRESYLFTKEIKGTETFDKNISIINQFTDELISKGEYPGNVTAAVSPNACGILYDHVPDGFPCVDQSKKLQMFLSDKSLLKGVNVVDLYSAMNAHGDEYIYYRTDHHWTTLGAYYAYLAISKNESPVSLKGLTEHSTGDFYGTLYAKYKGAFVEPDVLTYYEIPVKNYITDDQVKQGIYDLDKLEKFDKYGMFMCGNFGFSEVISGVCDNGKSLIIFKDSYANCLIPFLLYDYENIYVIDLRYYRGSVPEFVNSNSGADILFLYNFDFLNEDNHFYKLLK